MATVKKMMKAQNGADMVSKIKSAAQKGDTSRKMGYTADKKAESKIPKLKIKAKSGGSFPDLNKDGKITKADILKGRGVIAKSGTKMKMGGKAAKQAAIAISMKKAGVTPKKKMQYGGSAASMVPKGAMMKKGGMMKMKKK